eukprot:TRINITY_DN3174_c0_g1_i1.p1 TRINITY_DN3174_c0_g1~~TRINITY_DN3174_c0_g1_i1.p1  ORF type:complete len:225 (-),score=3.56 TRINITY_DN3174_c0_g1_i1:128-718(-)
MLISAKYYDFEIFVEVCWGIQAKKYKSQQWIKDILHKIYRMNTQQHSMRPKRSNNLQEFMFYQQLAKSQEEVNVKQRNLKVYKNLIFQWSKFWRYLHYGTERQKKKAQTWLENLQTNDVKLYLYDYEDCLIDVINVLDFVAKQVFKVEPFNELQDNIDSTLLYYFSKSSNSMAALKCRPFFLIIDQITKFLDEDNR